MDSEPVTSVTKSWWSRPFLLYQQNEKIYFMARPVSVIPVLRQEDHQFKASLGYRAKPYLKSNKRKGKKNFTYNKNTKHSLDQGKRY